MAECRSGPLSPFDARRDERRPELIDTTFPGMGSARAIGKYDYGVILTERHIMDGPRKHKRVNDVERAGRVGCHEP
jgi:hypothetical protein